MPAIVQNVRNQNVTCLELGAEEITRQMPFGTAWTKIRVGIRFNIIGQAMSIGDLIFGICQGPYGITSLQSIDAYGVCPGSFGDGFSWTPNYLSPGAGTTGWSSLRSQNGVFINVGRNGGITVPYFAGYAIGNSVVNVAYLDIIKTGTGITSGYWTASTTAQAQANTPTYQHLANLQNEVNAAFNVSLIQASYFTLSFASNYAWDSIFVSWNRSVPVVHLYEVSALMFY